MSEDSAGLFPIRTGIAESASDAWAAAFAVGRAALFDGRIRDPTVAVADEISALGYGPGRHGRLDSDYAARKT